MFRKKVWNTTGARISVFAAPRPSCGNHIKWAAHKIKSHVKNRTVSTIRNLKLTKRYKNCKQGLYEKQGNKNTDLCIRYFISDKICI